MGAKVGMMREVGSAGLHDVQAGSCTRRTRGRTRAVYKGTDVDEQRTREWIRHAAAQRTHLRAERAENNATCASEILN